MEITMAISRRQFLAGGTLLGASVSLAAITGCSSSAAAGDVAATSEEMTSSELQVTSSSRLIDVKESDVVATEECDIVVCGSGTSGTYAAVRSADLGAKVIWLEKTNLKGGTSNISEATLAPNTKELLERGLEIDKEAWFQRIMSYHNWSAYGPGVWCYLNNAGPAVDWALEHGAKMYAGVGETAEEAALYMCFDDAGEWTHNGPGELEPLWAYGDTLENLDFRLETPAVNIIKEDGKVTGVYAQSEEGIIRINAGAVIIATGGFAMNDEMKAERMRVPSERVHFLGMPGRDGDGINMALTAGTQSQAPTAIMYALSEIKDEDWASILSVVTQWPPHLRYPMEIGKTLPMVNEKGIRFYNETLADDSDSSRLNSAIASQPRVFTLFDEKHVKTYEGKENEEAFVAWMGVGGGELRESINSNSNVYQADSIAELAEMIGVDADTLVSTIEAYNACANGTGDPDPFGGDPENMTPLETAPFYAAEAQPNAFTTVGGVRGNEEARAVGMDGNPIEGLFVCGLDNASMQWNDYPYAQEGGSGQGSCVATGFAAANAACKDLGIA